MSSDAGSSQRCAGAAACALFATMLAAQTPPKVEASAPTDAEAAALAFPGSVVKEETTTLSAEQQQKAKDAAKVDTVPEKVVRYVATKDGKVVGHAYVDRHTVRTHAQKLLIVVDADGKVQRIEILAFDEPRQYRPRAAFYAQFQGKGLDDEMQPRRGIQPVAGATLTVRATVDAVRRVLAIHAQLGAK
ncbi:MAG TPA: FMN-binding protein [Planctomycetota bacterium]|nr:FMN-binding protein [Planctomycetota bacterium]